MYTAMISVLNICEKIKCYHSNFFLCIAIPTCDMPCILRSYNSIGMILIYGTEVNRLVQSSNRFRCQILFELLKRKTYSK